MKNTNKQPDPKMVAMLLFSKSYEDYLIGRELYWKASSSEVWKVAEDYPSEVRVCYLNHQDRFMKE